VRIGHKLNPLLRTGELISRLVNVRRVSAPVALQLLDSHRRLWSDSSRLGVGLPRELGFPY
jgi:hypothetical protein